MYSVNTVHACFPIGMFMSSMPRKTVGFLSCGAVTFRGGHTGAGSGPGPILRCLEGDGTSVVYLRRCVMNKQLAGGRISCTLESCPCGGCRGVSKTGNLNYCSHFPVLSTRPIGCTDLGGNSVTCGVGIGNSALLIIGGRLRSGGLARGSGRICHRVVGSPSGRGMSRKSHLLVKGLTRTSTVHTIRTSSVTHLITNCGKKNVVMYNSFGSSPVSCAREIMKRNLGSTFIRSKGNFNVSCGRGRFCFEVSGVLLDGGLGSCHYAISGAVGDSSRCPV